MPKIILKIEFKYIFKCFKIYFRSSCVPPVYRTKRLFDPKAPKPAAEGDQKTAKTSRRSSKNTRAKSQLASKKTTQTTMTGNNRFKKYFLLFSSLISRFQKTIKKFKFSSMISILNSFFFRNVHRKASAIEYDKKDRARKYLSRASFRSSNALYLPCSYKVTSHHPFQPLTPSFRSTAKRHIVC